MLLGTNLTGSWPTDEGVAKEVVNARAEWIEITVNEPKIFEPFIEDVKAIYIWAAAEKKDSKLYSLEYYSHTLHMDLQAVIVKDGRIYDAFWCMNKGMLRSAFAEMRTGYWYHYRGPTVQPAQMEEPNYRGQSAQMEELYYREPRGQPAQSEGGENPAKRPKEKCCLIS